MAYRFITDPGHGWLEVPAKEVALAIKEGLHFTGYSYYDSTRKRVYLEEDSDAGTFCTWYKDTTEKPLVYDLKNFEEDCFVRKLTPLRYVGQKG